MKVSNLRWNWCSRRSIRHVDSVGASQPVSISIFHCWDDPTPNNRHRTRRPTAITRLCYLPFLLFLFLSFRIYDFCNLLLILQLNRASLEPRASSFDFSQSERTRQRERGGYCVWARIGYSLIDWSVGRVGLVDGFVSADGCLLGRDCCLLKRKLCSLWKQHIYAVIDRHHLCITELVLSCKM